MLQDVTTIEIMQVSRDWMVMGPRAAHNMYAQLYITYYYSYIQFLLFLFVFLTPVDKHGTNHCLLQCHVTY